MAKKRILKELEITAIAAVDRPAQEHALSTILKRQDTDDKSDKDDNNIDDLIVSLEELERTIAAAKEVMDRVDKHDHKAAMAEALELAKKHVADAARETISRVQKNDANPKQGITKMDNKTITKREAETIFKEKVDALLIANPGMARHTAFTRVREIHPDLAKAWSLTDDFHRPQIDGNAGRLDYSQIQKARQEADAASLASSTAFMKKCAEIQKQRAAEAIAIGQKPPMMLEIMQEQRLKG